MKRLDLEMPDQFAFSTDLPVRVDDVNYGGHLGNDRVLTLVHEARIRFLREHGYTEKNVGGPGLIQVNAEIRYTSEGQLGDELRIKVAPDGLTSRGFDLFARLKNQTKDTVIANVRTGMIGFDYDQEKPARLPDSFVETMQDLTTSS